MVETLNILLNYLSSNSTLNIHDLETSNQLHLIPHYNQAGFEKSPSAESAHLSYVNLVKRNGRGSFTAPLKATNQKQLI